MARKLDSDQLDRLARELFQSRTPEMLARRPDAAFLVGFRSKLTAELEVGRWSPLMIGELCWRFTPIFAIISLLLVGLLVVVPPQMSAETAVDQVLWRTLAASETADFTRDQVVTAVIFYEGGKENR